MLEVPPAPLQHILRLHAAAAELLLLHPVLHTAPAGEKIFAVVQKYFNMGVLLPGSAHELHGNGVQLPRDLQPRELLEVPDQSEVSIASS